MVSFVEGGTYKGADPICECLLRIEEVEAIELEGTHILETPLFDCIHPIKLELACKPFREANILSDHCEREREREQSQAAYFHFQDLLVHKLTFRISKSQLALKHVKLSRMRD
jgi:hypothetical protein